MNHSIISFVIAAALVAVLCMAWAKGFFRRSRRERAQPPLRKFAPVFIACAGFMSAIRCAFCATPPEFALANLNEGIHRGGKLNYYADAAHTYRYLLVKEGTDAKHVAVTGAADQPLGLCTDQPAAAEDRVAVDTLGASDETKIMVGSEAIAKGSLLYTAAAGQVQDEPTVAGTYWLVGRALEACAGANEPFEVEPMKPIKVVIIAALTAPVTAAATDLATAQALANACKADLLAIDNALAAPAILKVI